MALINHLPLITKQRQTLHREVDAVVSIFTDDDGAKFLQIDTFGSPERKNAGEVNQSIQLSRSGASELLKLIVHTYRDLE